MKLLPIGPKVNEEPGLLDAKGVMRDLSGLLPELTSAHLGRVVLDNLAAIDPAQLPPVEGPLRTAPIVAGIGR
jgi:2,4-diketo-3-deoxy-L-fuconate hydrolase